MTKRVFCKLLFVALAISGLLVCSRAVLAQGQSEQAFERVKQVQERHTDRLMAIDGVVGTAVGLDDNDRPAVNVFLEQPKVGGIPRELDGIPVHPVVTGKFYALPRSAPEPALLPSEEWPRPVPIGVSTGHRDVTAGTIGCRVIDPGGNVYALSNNHVFANENMAILGDNVLQPGAYDGGIDPDDAIGILADFEPIKFDGSNNTIDAAIALSSTVLLGNATPPGGYGAPRVTTIPAKLRQSVQKYGRTTGLTKGRVYAVNATVNVGYDSGVARFVNQIVITPGVFSAGGDSGSLIVTQEKGTNNRRTVGLLFAGSSSYTIANPIGAVLSRFGVTVDGE